MQLPTIFIAFLFILVPGAFGQFGNIDTPAATRNVTKPRSPQQQYEAVLSDLQQARAELAKLSTQTQEAGQRQTLNEKTAALYRKFAPRFFDLAERYPNQSFAMQALVIVLGNLPDGPETARAIRLVVKDHLADPKLGEICQLLTLRGTPTAEKLASSVLEQSHDHKLQADALLALAQYWKAKSDGEGVSMAEVEKYSKKAERFYGRILNEYADVKGVVAQARPELFEVQHLSCGREAPNIAGIDSAGRKLELTDYRGKVVVIDFWADWCAACLALVPSERALLQRMHGKPFALLGVNLDPTREVMRRSEEKHHIAWPSFFDGSEGPILKTWNIHVMPTIFVLDSAGIVRYKGQDMDEASRVAESLVKRLEARSQGSEVRSQGRNQ